MKSILNMSKEEIMCAIRESFVHRDFQPTDEWISDFADKMVLSEKDRLAGRFWDCIFKPDCMILIPSQPMIDEGHSTTYYHSIVQDI